jgi:hypothetical protein
MEHLAQQRCGGCSEAAAILSPNFADYVKRMQIKTTRIDVSY